MLPQVICVPDTIEIPRRLSRRGHLSRMKDKAARQWVRWAGRRNPLVKSSGSDGTKYFTAKEIQGMYGRLAAMHCTHVCGMCKHEKHSGIPHIASGESVRVYDLSDL